MNSVKITQTLQQALVDYLLTTFDANKDGNEPELALKIREAFEHPKALFTGPYLELVYPYDRSDSISELCEKGVLSKQIMQLTCFSLPKPEPIPLDAALYSHQHKAIQKLCVEKRSIVISSGTGSGKTEGFSIPIVNDLLEDDTPGVRALLVYPLNALVNDQMERFRSLLKDTKITFGRFTSELPNEAVRDSRTLPNEIISREEIRTSGRIPQILITNYAMLEYLLLRPEDSALFNSGTWKFIVLDEAHTYSGAQGIEVSMLIRRLKQRLGKKRGEVLCIATSATLVNDDSAMAAEFAKNLFDEDLKSDDVIFGDEDKDHFLQTTDDAFSPNPNAYLHNDLEKMFEEIRKDSQTSQSSDRTLPDIEIIALYLIEVGLIGKEEFALTSEFEKDLPGFLYKVFSSNKDLQNLRNWMVGLGHPVLFSEAADFLFPTMDDLEKPKALYRLIEIGAMARPAPNLLPLLPAKYHLFARPPQGIWTCINPSCSNRVNQHSSIWSQVYSNPTETCESCGAKVYPLYLCRECGQVFIASHYRPYTNQFLPAVDQLTEEDKKRYFTWRRIEENIIFADETSSEDILDEDGETQANIQQKFHQDGHKICLHCCKLIQLCNCGNKTPSIELYDIQENKTQTKKKQQSVCSVPVELIDDCPRCRSKSKSETEVITPITLRGAGPLANLTNALYRELPPATDTAKKKLPGEGRKLLSFYDSRQGAARFAAFLQDTSNKQNYRHIIPQAIHECKKPDDWENGSAPNLITLAKKAGELSWRQGVLQNDPNSDYWRQGREQFDSNNRKNASIWMAKAILGEFTTGRRSRQSLESMGLVGVKYFSEDDQPNFTVLAKKIGLNSEQTESLVGFLLDDLRYLKAVKLPDGISADDPEFGTNKGNPKIIRQGKPRPGEQRWIGSTPKQARRRYIQQVLMANNLAASDTNVIDTLTCIWDWLTTEVENLFTGSVNVGYQISPNHIYFDDDHQWFRCSKCQRFSYRGNSLPCPHPHCAGELIRIDITSNQRSNYYYNLFQKPLVPIRVEEHTAQLDSEKGKQYQNWFKDGHINVLSCSTTFEMGIDLGDLQAVVMSNVPPSVSNYRQRSGRAGRRTSGSAYILTWASDRPHDQAYYNDPIEIISGRVAVPYINLDNEFILRRHVNAILLSLFLQYRKHQGVPISDLTFNGEFFDAHLTERPHFSYIEEWQKSEKEAIRRQLSDFASSLPENQWPFIKNGFENFFSDLRRLNAEHYQPITQFYRDKIKELGTRMADSASKSSQNNDGEDQYRYYKNLLDRMRGSKGKTTGYLIEYLSGNGVLPSYSFPLHTVELILPKQYRMTENLRLERDLRQAIKEYAPGSEIVADKRLWKIAKPVFWKDTPRLLEYRICGNCHHLQISDDAGIELPNTEGKCPVCFQDFTSKSKIRKFVEPDGFLADSKSGKPAKQFVNIEPSQMRSALIPEQSLEEEETNKFIRIAYNQKGKLLYVNEGKYGKGFTFPVKAFAFDSISENDQRLSLGHIQTTNTLHIRFVGYEQINIPKPGDLSFWLSLLYAIIHGASHRLQIERRDIDGVLFPRSVGSTWEQTIVLYDNVPGGAGHVKKIKENLIEVLQEARRILNCIDCAPDTSCYHCLRDFNNQFFHQYLKRDQAQKFLDLLVASLIPLESELPGAVRIITSDATDWFLEKIRYARQTVFIAIVKIEFGHPQGDNYTWLDTLGDLLEKRCKVHLYLQQLPQLTPQGFSLAAQLQVLINRGLSVWKVDELPRWQVIIDKDQSDRRVIASEMDSERIKLSENIGINHLISSTSNASIDIVVDQWNELQKMQIKASDLSLPQSIKVINLRAAARTDITEQSLFGKFFEKPVKKMFVHDPYLLNHEQIVNRLGQYILLANQSKTLEEVIVQTKKYTESNSQIFAEKVLLDEYPGLIKFVHNAEHDRFVEVTRVNGDRAKIIIGRGLDFIRPDGSVRSTYIVIQDPVED